MLTFIESVRAHFRLTRLLKAMTKQGLNYYQAVTAIEHHVHHGTIGLLEQEWLS